MPFSPALLILWAPGGFRFTCYYYRGSYYKAMWADHDPTVPVGEPYGRRISARAILSARLQNIHRLLLCTSRSRFSSSLAYDLRYDAFWFSDAAGHRAFGMGLGTIILALNLGLLSSYTLRGCHSFRHLVGGILDKLSGHPARKKAYDCASCLNRNHERIAWASLVMVGFSDVYIRLACSMGIWTDWRLF